MATKKEKQLTVLLLKERLERLTGKKVMLEESIVKKLTKILDVDENEEVFEDDELNDSLSDAVDAHGEDLWDAVLEWIDAARSYDESKLASVGSQIAKTHGVGISALKKAVDSYYRVLKNRGVIK